jgi:hypothetical protein
LIRLEISRIPFEFRVTERLHLDDTSRARGV